MFAFRDVAGVWPDETIGGILLLVALVILCVCLILIVRLLHLLLRGRIAVILKKFVNADFPGHCSHVTGYLAILIGAGLTILVQSSSIFTSAITPLVGVGVLKITRMYPLTLGANIGTTTTGLLAALATSGKTLPDSLQVAFCHLFFNLSGILIFYPIPFMRAIPIHLAKFLGNETAKYRWFAFLYLFFMFFLLPGAVFGLSLAGWYVLVGVACPFLLLLLIILFIKLLQKKRPGCLPEKLRDWKFLPVYFRSLEPVDRVLGRIKSALMCFKCCKEEDTEQLNKGDVKENGGMDNAGFVSTKM